MRNFFITLGIFIFSFVNIQTSLAKDYTVHKLPTGQTLIIKEVHDNQIVAIDTWIKTGSINENDSNNGVAHFLEHMFFKGTTNYPTGKFDQLLESKGAITNAATSKDYTHYYIVIPSKDFNLAMELHSDMLLNPMLSRNELEMERKVVLEEIARGNDNPEVILYKNLNSILYKEHPYKREVIGTQKIIETITREEMYDFYQKWYNPNNMITVIVGDVNTPDVIKSAENHFKTTNIIKTPNIEHKKEHINTKNPTKTTNLDINIGYLAIGFHGVKPTQKKESAALDVLATILGTGKSSRLYQNILENQHLCTSIQAGHSSLRDDSTFFIKSKFEPKNQQKLENEIWFELAKLKKYKITQDELDKAKKIINRETLYSRESVSNIANELGYTTMLLNPSYYDNYLKEINKVTIKDVNSVADKYINMDNAAISYVMPKNTTVKNKDKKYILNKLKNFSPQNTTTSKTVVLKQYPDNKNAKLVSENKTTKKYILENGLTLIITQNKTNDIVALNILSKGGAFQETIDSKKGTGQLLAELLTTDTKNYSTQELSNILDENGIEFSSQMLPDSFNTSIKMTKNELEIALNVFDEVINNSLLKQEDIDKIRSKKLQRLKAINDLPSTIAFDEMKYLLWESTPYNNASKIMEKAYTTVTANDIKKLYNQIYSPQNTIVAVNGDVDEQQLINYFSVVFKDKTYKTFTFDECKKMIFPIMQNKSKVIEKNGNQSWVVLAYRTPKLDRIKDWATLKIIDTILGTGMSSRLFTELRDKQGLAYVVASTYQSNMLQGAFITYIGTNPHNIDFAKNEMLKEIDKFKKNFVSSKELQQAKDQIWGNYLLSQETNSEKANTVASFELYNRGYDFEQKYMDYINSVTEQDIIEVANRYFDAPVITIIVK